MDKGAHLHGLCRTREDYRQLWDEQAEQKALQKVCENWVEVSGGMWKCEDCDRLAGARTRDSLPKHRLCGEQRFTTPEPALGFGPGTELAALLASIGIKELPGCGCKKKMAQMDRWGVNGCKERFEEIVGWMRDGYDKAGLLAKVRAAAFAAATGLAFKLEPGNPLPGLIREAIRRAQEKCPA